MEIEKTLQKATDLWDGLDPTLLPRLEHAPLKQWIQYHKIKRAMNKCMKQKGPITFQSLAKAKESHHLAECFLQMPVPDDLHGDYVKVTEAFMKRAKVHVSDLSEEDLFQALRNVWIMVLIQVLADHPIGLSDAMFGYSMLYPLTDNVMDDPDLSEAYKHQFIKRFGRRLKGENLKAENPHEADVFFMIECIERDFPREKSPHVYESVMAIFEAQSKSLYQQYQSLSVEEIKRITFEKGATSVLADGFLVLGNLDESMFSFLIHYGIALQLSDDLQDMVTDEAVNHKTLFNASEDKDALMNKLFRFTDQVLAQVPQMNKGRGQLIKRLLDVSTSALYSDAIFTHREYFSKALIQSVDKSHAMGLKNHAKLKRHAQNCLSILR